MRLQLQVEFTSWPHLWGILILFIYLFCFFSPLNRRKTFPHHFESGSLSETREFSQGFIQWRSDHKKTNCMLRNTRLGAEDEAAWLISPSVWESAVCKRWASISSCHLNYMSLLIKTGTVFTKCGFLVTKTRNNLKEEKNWGFYLERTFEYR